VGNFQPAVHFMSESHDKSQFNWNFCPCLQDVSKTALDMKSLLVFLICSWNRKELNRVEYKKMGDSSDPRTSNILNLQTL
jgi:hypothetical protein